MTVTMILPVQYRESVTFECLLHAAFVADTFFWGDELEPARVYVSKEYQREV